MLIFLLVVLFLDIVAIIVVFFILEPKAFLAIGISAFPVPGVGCRELITSSAMSKMAA